MDGSVQLGMWALGITVVAILNGLHRGDAAARAITLLLISTWVGSNLLVALYGVPTGMRLFPLLDLAAGLFAFWTLIRHPAAWLRFIVAIFALLLVSHASFWTQRYLGFDSHQGLYIRVINSLFALQLVCAAWPGGAYVGKHIGHWVREHLHRRDLA